MRDDEEEDVNLADSRPTALPNDPDFPGHTVAGYVLDGEIGRGGMGVVYAATHPLIGKRVAIKVLSHELASDRVTLERFLLEARAVNAIGHPNIVDTFDFGILPDGRQYLVMDLLVGETLRTRLRRGPLSIGEASVIVDEIASALAAAHNKGIIHRDLKPDNVFIVVQLNRTPQIKLLDFGLVKLTATSTDGVERTRSGAIVGTPNYMSPEQARARGHLDHRTDIYALGVVTFEMIAGHLPYIRDNALDTLIAHVQEEIPSLHETVDRVPIELAQLVEAMMSKAPSDRPTLAAIRQVLKRMPHGDISMRVEFKTPKPIAPPQRTVAERPRAASRPGTPRPALEVPPDIEHASSPAIPEPAYRSSPAAPAYVDEYQPGYDEDHTNVSVPPPPRPRAPTVPPGQRASTPHPIRRDTPPMGTRARRESAPLPRIERPPTEPAPAPIEEEDDLASAWLPSNTDPTAVTPDGVVPPYPEMIRATSRAETAPPPTRAVTRPAELTPASGIPVMTPEGERPPLPSILARATSASEHELPTAIGGEPLRDLDPDPETTTSGPPPDKNDDQPDDEDFSSLAEPQRPNLPTRRTAPRVSTTNLHRPTEKVPSLAIPPPDFEPPSTWQNEAPTLVTPPELAALLSPRDPTPLVDLDSPRSPSENDVITSAPRRSSPSDAPPLSSEEPRVDRSYGEPDTPHTYTDRAESDAPPAYDDQEPAHAYDAPFDPAPRYAADEEQPHELDNPPAHAFDRPAYASDEERPHELVDAPPTHAFDDEGPAHRFDARQPLVSDEPQPNASDPDESAQAFDAPQMHLSDEGRELDAPQTLAPDETAHVFEDRPSLVPDETVHVFEDRPTITPDEIPRAFEDRPTLAPGAGPNAFEDRPTITPDEIPRAFEDRPTLAPGAGALTPDEAAPPALAPERPTPAPDVAAGERPTPSPDPLPSAKPLPKPISPFPPGALLKPVSVPDRIPPPRPRPKTDVPVDAPKATTSSKPEVPPTPKPAPRGIPAWALAPLPGATEEAPPAPTRTPRKSSESNASITAASLMRSSTPTPYSPARTLRDSKLNLPAVTSGPTTAREFDVPGPPTLKNIEVPTDSIVETVVQPPGTPIPERARGSTIPPGVDPAVDQELEDAFGLAVDQGLPSDDDEPGLTVEIEDPRPTSEISAMQDVEGLMDGIPSGIALEAPPEEEAAESTRSPKTRSSPNLAELWSSELERSTAQRAAVEARADVHDAETVVAVTSSEMLAAGDSMTGATTITSRRRPTTNTKLESPRESKPAPAPALPPKPLPVFKPITPPPTRDDDDDDGGLLGTFGLDIHVNIDVAFESDPGPAPVVIAKSPPPPVATPVPIASEDSGHSKRSSKRSGAVTKPPLADASAKIEPVERRDRASQRTIDTPSRRASDKLDRSKPLETPKRPTPVPSTRSEETSGKSGRTPSARAIERAIDRQMAGRDPDAPSRAWLYIFLVLALAGAGVLGYLKYF